MKRLLATVALLAVSVVASAQALVAGEVKKVDKPAGRITLKHAEIKADRKSTRLNSSHI